MRCPNTSIILALALHLGFRMTKSHLPQETPANDRIAVQVQRYEPFDYKPQTDILVYRDANAMKLMENLK